MDTNNSNLTLSENSKKTPNEWADWWPDDIGVNVIPANSKTKGTWIEWEKYQKEPIPIEQHNEWKNSNSFENGIAIILGRAFHRKIDSHLYLIGIDLDNKKAIDTVCNIKGKQMTIQDLAHKTLVEMHDDDPTRAHVYVYSEKLFPHVKSNSDDDKLIEVKGSEGIHICSGSIHKNGYPISIIGTDQPMKNEEFVEHVLAVAGIKPNEKIERIPVKARAKQKHYAGNNRHEEVLVYAESLLFNDTIMAVNTEEEVKQYTREFNNKQCVPPLDDKEFEKVWNDALRFVRKNKTEHQSKGYAAGMDPVNIIEEASKTIMQKYSIVTIEESKEILYYNNGVYVPGGDIIIEKEAEAMFNYKLSLKAVMK